MGAQQNDCSEFEDAINTLNLWKRRKAVDRVITDEMVERAAKAYVDTVYDELRAYGYGYELDWNWESWEEESKDRKRRCVRKALEAALNAAPDTQRMFEAAEAQVKELEARNAVLREALQACTTAMRLWGTEEDGIPADSYIGAYAVYEQAKKVLSSDAGRDLLEKLKKLETVAKAAQILNDRIYTLQIHNFDRELEESVDTLEEALAALEDGEQDG